MFTNRTARRFVAAAIAAAALLLPAIASADAPSEGNAPAQRAGKQHRAGKEGRQHRRGQEGKQHRRGKEGKRGHAHANFPIDGQVFTKRIDRRLNAVAKHMENRMAKAKVPAAKRAEARTKFAANAAKIRKAAAVAARDGKVTKAEAQRVREMVKRYRGKPGNRGQRGNRGNRGKRPNRARNAA